MNSACCASPRTHDAAGLEGIEGRHWGERSTRTAVGNRLGKAYPPQQFVKWLVDVLSTEPLPANSDEAGRVRVLSAQSIRALEVPYLFVAGLSEKSFPPPARDDRIYSDAECDELNRGRAAFRRSSPARQRRDAAVLRSDHPRHAAAGAQLSGAG